MTAVTIYCSNNKTEAHKGFNSEIPSTFVSLGFCSLKYTGLMCFLFILHSRLKGDNDKNFILLSLPVPFLISQFLLFLPSVLTIYNSFASQMFQN